MVKRATAKAKETVKIQIGIFPGNILDIEIENGSTVRDGIEAFQAETGLTLENYDMRINDTLSTRLNDILEDGDMVYFTAKKDGSC